MASEAALARSRSFGEDYSDSPVSPSTSGLVAGREKCSKGSTITPSSARNSGVYRRLKRRLGRSLRRHHCQRRVVRPRKSSLHKLFRTESSFSGPQEL